ncbi:MAG: acyl-CoA dehydrogenase family protein, partial [Burkholderiales bacterium]|nr:acyl-CoA dehydrogenase family protein [Burkholderiales bacterium]
MDLNFTAEETAFRLEVRQWVADHLPAATSHKVRHGLRLSRDDLQGWARILGARGWLAAGWPREFGGPGWSAIQKH